MGSQASLDKRLSKLPEIVKDREAWPCLESMGSQRVGHDSLVAQTVKRLPVLWETRVRSLGWEDPLEKEMATHSSTLA